MKNRTHTAKAVSNPLTEHYEKISYKLSAKSCGLKRKLKLLQLREREQQLSKDI
ncbi:hypothetical protein LINPERPRIM_LOCUS32949, partial [Linum perenne]